MSYRPSLYLLLSTYDRKFSRAGTISRLEPIKDPSCLYWVDPKYQVCLSNNQMFQDLDIIWNGSSDVVGQSGRNLL